MNDVAKMTIDNSAKYISKKLSHLMSNKNPKKWKTVNKASQRNKKLSQKNKKSSKI